MFETSDEKEKLILVAVDTGTGTAEKNLDELSELVSTADALVVGRLIQNRDAFDGKFYIGKGKIDELKSLIELTGATGIVCDDELTGSQQRNINDAIGAKVMDRTLLILDIFAKHAVTSEGKLQVEMAQLKYNLSHLIGIGNDMSRLGGGIGTRGPGEKKLETDRRYIREQINNLKNELIEVQKHRDIVRKQREKVGFINVSLVGYTNAGKSTVMNLLTDAGVLSQDKLFATLTNTTRKIVLPGGREVLLSDTIGFIQKLPHNLVEAFKGTLEELSVADIFVHVVDASSQNRETQIKTVYKTLDELKVLNKPIITLYNKMDKDIERPLPNDGYATTTLQISALNLNDGEKILSAIEEILKSFNSEIKLIIPFSESRVLSEIYGKVEVISEEHTAEGTMLKILADDVAKIKFKRFMIDLD